MEPSAAKKDKNLTAESPYMISSGTLPTIPLEASEENYTKIVNQIDNDVKKMMSKISSVVIISKGVTTL